MSEKYELRFQSAFWLVLAALCSLGLAGCALFTPSDITIYVDGEYRDSRSSSNHTGTEAMIDQWFIKRTAVINGQTVTYYVDRSDTSKIYTMRREKDCHPSLCYEDRYFTPPEEPLRQQLLELEAARQISAVQSSPPELPSLLPDPRITVPTLPPVPLPQD